MGTYVLQSVLDQLPISFLDAMRLDTAVEKSLADITARRNADDRPGSGRPQGFHESLNRSVVGAAVGGIEAYFETLATATRDIATPLPAGCTGWFTIDGPNGEIQNPSPWKIRKLFWSLFHVDLMDSWDFTVTTSNADHGGTGTWRTAHNHRHTGADARDFLNAMVHVRNSFAHMDPTHHTTAIGMARKSTSGKVSVQSHHAFNAVSVALQLSVQSTVFLSRQLGLNSMPRPRWKKPWEAIGHGLVGIDYWLRGTPVWSNEILGWVAAPTDLDQDLDHELQEVTGVPPLI